MDFIISTGKLCVRLDLFHWWDHFPSNLKSFLEDYNWLHRKLGSDVPFQLLLTGRPGRGKTRKRNGMDWRNRNGGTGKAETE